MNKKIESINLMLGGEKPNIIVPGNWCAVDSGADYLLNVGIKPLMIYGDLDSIGINYNGLNINKKDSQDITDLEFAINSIKVDFPMINNINIYGATGGRLDHFFGNIMILSNENINSIEVQIIDDNNIIYLSNIGDNIVSKNNNFKYISFVPIYKNTKVTIKNAKYDVEDYILTTNKPNATSNEFLDKDIFLRTDKRCLVIYSKD
ncbi:thiamine diphosphokinase [Gemelliphila palaticanis]|uniref:Thiamine diphosphokinase n=1 Tax=Gemelliphila palaticanis TaxID=81950 RepID=A0ABX2SZB1_9BACL|nr:thiamine diphosphokinase [Gemella palaticanis]MBF0715291.1 thiamine diphosphokinase [Gemella palaticanis]NYS47221.1 thiamine diphosphokinase [Gemella palaticanis]